MSDAIEAFKAGLRNPGADAAAPLTAPERIPMTMANRKLEVPELPGWWLQWILGTPQRILQAQRAGFSFVSRGELQTNSFDFAGDAKAEGSTDMGSHISIISGADEQGKPLGLYLMKQRKEHHDADEALVQCRNDSVVDALTASFDTGRPMQQGAGEKSEDVALRFVDKERTKIPELFRRKPPKGR